MCKALVTAQGSWAKRLEQVHAGAVLWLTSLSVR